VYINCLDFAPRFHGHLYITSYHLVNMTYESFHLSTNLLLLCYYFITVIVQSNLHLQYSQSDKYLCNVTGKNMNKYSCSVPIMALKNYLLFYFKTFPRIFIFKTKESEVINCHYSKNIKSYKTHRKT